MGLEVTSALAIGSARSAAAAATNVAATGIGLAVLPAREATKALSGDLPGLTLTRRCWRGNGRAWIEVRGLDGPSGRELGPAVLAALRALPGVTSASLNYPLSRVVVGIGDDTTTLRDLCRVVAGAESHGAGGKRPAGPPALPGDGLLTATRATMLGVHAVGLGAAVTGRALRWPRLPASVEAAVAVVDYQPRLRRLLEDRIGAAATDTVLTLAMAAAHTVTLAPATLAVDTMLEVLKTAECRAEARAWSEHEPGLARHADQPSIRAPSRPAPPRDGPVERHLQRSAWIQAVGAAVVGAATRSVNMAGTAALVTAPKASRTTRESFAATLGRGLAEQHAVLPLRPESLRRLDRVDAIVIDPRVLCVGKLRVVRVRGAAEGDLSAVWDSAQARLEDNDRYPGWHPVPGRGPGVEALYQPSHHPLASVVLGEARRSGVELISVDIDALGELRPAFDEIGPLRNESVDDALSQALAALQGAGRTVAVLSSAGAQALASADVALGVMPDDDTAPPPWCADLMLADLAGAWRLLHALPAARAASRRGIEIAAGASALGALLMLPDVRGRGPGPVTTGAAAGLLSGYLLARRAVRTATPRPAPALEWHAMSVAQVRKALPPPESDADEPLGSPIPARALATAQRFAELAGAPRRAVWQFVKGVGAELSDPLTPVLALGSAASAILGSPVDAVLVGSVLSGNAMLAASQRLRAESRLNRLLAQQIPPARKVTTGADGKPVYADVVAAQLRPGDVIEVRTHEVIPADARLIDEVDVEVDESTLTGESLSVEKQVEATPGAELAERRCMLFAGTTVVAGTAVAVVTAVGADTQARRAAELVSGEPPAVGLQHQLSQLTNRAFPISMVGGTLVSALGLFRRKGLRQAVASGIAVTVAAVPEGMPLVATLAQAASARRLTNFGALVRIPRSVEALGRVDVVCFDKTGTLTENSLRVAQVRPAPGYSADEVLRCAAQAGPPALNGGRPIHATDSAILEAARAVDSCGGVHNPDAHLPFRSGRSFSASVTGDQLTVKGAPEVVRAACRDTRPGPDPTVRGLANGGLRVIAVARRRLSPEQIKAVENDPDDDALIADLSAGELSLVGYLGMSDTPRPQAADLLANLHRSGVGIRLITGDHPITAAAIARELGMPVTAEQVITGAEWDAMSRRDQERTIADRVVFARMSPENKVQIVQTLERTGRVCAMVGDGSNDAAAIRAATVGIGVVGHGSDPARVAADVVLLDGRIESLLNAIEEGRQLWQRVQAAVSVLLGGNAGEVAFAIIGSAITGSSPLNTRQLLLVNMLTDALPAAALAVSTPNEPVARNGRGPDQSALWRAVGVRGATTAAAATTAWAMASVTGRPRRASTVALVALVAAQLGQTLLDSHDRLVVLTAAGSLATMATVISVPGVSQLLGCTPLGPLGWAQALGPAAVATVATGVISRRVAAGHPSAAGQPAGDQAPTSSTPTRHSTAYTSRSGAVSSPPSADANRSASASVIDITSRVTARPGAGANPTFRKGE